MKRTITRLKPAAIGPSNLSPTEMRINNPVNTEIVAILFIVTVHANILYAKYTPAKLRTR
jgi:hypothetical protein